ncbi:NAD(P)-binding protein [Sorangium sp. So ce124]|uniref:NAD(P)-binding protein n=1 Tax=Sorangium sp. So ce124 TaxID=3133280 RepID=UPI003F607DE7
MIGAGPNGLAAAVALAGAGLAVRMFEARDTIGRGARTAELTGPDFRHDVCSAIHATAVFSPFFQMLPLAEHGVAWIHAEAALAHPLPHGRAALLYPDLGRIAETLDEEDSASWRDLFAPLLAQGDALLAELLGPRRLRPRHPLLLAQFGISGVRSAAGLARDTFRGDAARGLLGGCAAHSFLPLEALFSASFGLALALAAHAAGWPIVRTGSRALIVALAAILRARAAARSRPAAWSPRTDGPGHAGRALRITGRRDCERAFRQAPYYNRRRETVPLLRGADPGRRDQVPLLQQHAR